VQLDFIFLQCQLASLLGASATLLGGAFPSCCRLLAHFTTHFGMMNLLRSAQEMRLSDIVITHAMQLYLGFSFPGVQGWVQQNFFNVTVGPPSRDVFVLPSGVSALHMPAALCDSVTATSIHPQLRVTHSINYLPFSACSKLDIPDCQ
jgi:hypothetical protein